MYADDIQLYLSFMPLSTSPRHGALKAIQASVSDTISTSGPSPGPPNVGYRS